jgi:hypothetical protein
VVGSQAVGGGPIAAVNSCCQAVAHGQWVGNRRVARRAERVTRAATLIRWARIVAVTALAWNRSARTPVARVRLNAMAASTSQVEFAEKTMMVGASRDRF